MLIQHTFIPRYFQEFTPVELTINKTKVPLKSEHLRHIGYNILGVEVYECIDG